MINPRKDGHIHSPFCPHGTSDCLEMYVERALEKGLTEISFTEHLPLPKGFMNQKILDESSPNEKVFAEYIGAVKELKKKYRDKIKIFVGAEIDYIEGLENETMNILNKFKDDLEDTILSVHFLKIKDKYYALDYGLKEFKELIDLTGSLNNLYDLYYETVIKSIRTEFRHFKPNRIGHPSLIRIFNKAYPHKYNNKELLMIMIEELKKAGYDVDYNTAGIRKEYCGEVYPTGVLNGLIDLYKITKVYGSDSHSAKDVGFGFGVL